jgi:hypothetical protein
MNPHGMGTAAKERRMRAPLRYPALRLWHYDK